MKKMLLIAFTAGMILSFASAKQIFNKMLWCQQTETIIGKPGNQNTLKIKNGFKIGFATRNNQLWVYKTGFPQLIGTYMGTSKDGFDIYNVGDGRVVLVEWSRKLVLTPAGNNMYKVFRCRVDH